MKNAATLIVFVAGFSLLLASALFINGVVKDVKIAEMEKVTLDICSEAYAHALTEADSLRLQIRGCSAPATY